MLNGMLLLIICALPSFALSQILLDKFDFPDCHEEHEGQFEAVNCRLVPMMAKKMIYENVKDPRIAGVQIDEESSSTYFFYLQGLGRCVRIPVAAALGTAIMEEDSICALPTSTCPENLRPC